MCPSHLLGDHVTQFVQLTKDRTQGSVKVGLEKCKSRVRKDYNRIRIGLWWGKSKVGLHYGRIRIRVNDKCRKGLGRIVYS